MGIICSTKKKQPTVTTISESDYENCNKEADEKNGQQFPPRYTRHYILHPKLIQYVGRRQTKIENSNIGSSYDSFQQVYNNNVSDSKSPVYCQSHRSNQNSQKRLSLDQMFKNSQSPIVVIKRNTQHPQNHQVMNRKIIEMRQKERAILQQAENYNKFKDTNSGIVITTEK